MDDSGTQVAGSWRRWGLIFRPDPGKWWMRSHAALPVPMQFEGSVYRVYFSSRDAGNRSHIGFFDIDLDEPTRILRVAEQPLLAPGPLGYFDDHGIYAASAVRCENRIYLYTIGWNPGSRPPLFYSSIGLAVSDDGGESFRKHGVVPIMARSEFDPCLVTSPFVLCETGLWRMWYVSGQAWRESADGLRSRYHIKYAESENGIDWRRNGLVCIDHADEAEQNIARCCVLREGGAYHAWFCSDRGNGYRIALARSGDGITWKRLGEPEGLAPSEAGWDSRAMAYPHVVRHGSTWYMFYNGNSFGRDGIGLATAPYGSP